MPRKSPGGPRDAVLTVRLPARVKVGLELISRLHREPMTDVIVRALSEALTSENGGLLVRLPGEEHPTYLLPKVWDERDCVRLVKVALAYPSLLTRAEQLAWDAIRRDDRYWVRPPTKDGKKPAKKASLSESRRRIEDLQADVLEADWESLSRPTGPS